MLQLHGSSLIAPSAWAQTFPTTTPQWQGKQLYDPWSRLLHHVLYQRLTSTAASNLNNEARHRRALLQKILLCIITPPRNRRAHRPFPSANPLRLSQTPSPSRPVVPAEMPTPRTILEAVHRALPRLLRPNLPLRRLLLPRRSAPKLSRSPRHVQMMPSLNNCPLMATPFDLFL